MRCIINMQHDLIMVGYGNSSSLLQYLIPTPTILLTIPKSCTMLISRSVITTPTPSQPFSNTTISYYNKPMATQSSSTSFSINSCKSCPSYTRTELPPLSSRQTLSYSQNISGCSWHSLNCPRNPFFLLLPSRYHRSLCRPF